MTVDPCKTIGTPKIRTLQEGDVYFADGHAECRKVKIILFLPRTFCMIVLL